MGQKVKQAKHEALVRRRAMQDGDSRIGRSEIVCKPARSFTNSSADEASHLPVVEGITIDKEKTMLMDDGLSFEKTANGWRISVSIVDLSPLIPEGGPLEKAASIQRVSKHVAGEALTHHLFPHDLLSAKASFRPGQKRPAITFDIELDNQMNVVHSDIRRTMFSNKFQHYFNAFDQSAAANNEHMEWLSLGRALYEKRVAETTIQMRKAIGLPDSRLPELSDLQDGIESPSKRLVTEVLYLANTAAAQYVAWNRLDMPVVPRRGRIEVSRVTDSFEFDQAINRMAVAVQAKLMGEATSYLHVTSPMRNYVDYLDLKIIGRHIDVQPPTAYMQESVRSLSAEFANAAGACALVKPHWRRTWEALGETQSDWRLPCEKSADSHYAKLRKLCRTACLSAPAIAERKIEAGGLTFYLIALNLTGRRGMDIRGIGLSPDSEQAMEMASEYLCQRAQRFCSCPLPQQKSLKAS